MNGVDGFLACVVNDLVSFGAGFSFWLFILVISREEVIKHDGY